MVGRAHDGCLPLHAYTRHCSIPSPSKAHLHTQLRLSHLLPTALSMVWFSLSWYLQPTHPPTHPPTPQYGEAAAAYTEALRLARQPQDVATLLSNRSAAYARWGGRRGGGSEGGRREGGREGAREAMGVTE